MIVLALIGARSGSKGVPGKNVRLLGGRPLLSYAVTTAVQCQRIGRVVFSTDSPEYAEIARALGAEVPFIRPAELAADTSTDIEYILHALQWLENNESYRPDAVVRLCPTAPFVRPFDVDRCIELLAADADAHSVIAMTPAQEHPRKAARISSDGRHAVSFMTERGADLSPKSRQMHVEAFNRQGLPIVSRLATILELGSQTGDRVLYHVLPQETAVDIDTEFDFRVAELLMGGSRPSRP
jgi:CMP-N,N'-diacetyllegionaminic acid synthase